MQPYLRDVRISCLLTRSKGRGAWCCEPIVHVVCWTTQYQAEPGFEVRTDQPGLETLLWWWFEMDSQFHLPPPYVWFTHIVCVVVLKGAVPLNWQLTEKVIPSCPPTQSLNAFVWACMGDLDSFVRVLYSRLCTWPYVDTDGLNPCQCGALVGYTSRSVCSNKRSEHKEVFV